MIQWWWLLPTSAGAFCLFPALFVAWDALEGWNSRRIARKVENARGLKDLVAYRLYSESHIAEVSGTDWGDLAPSAQQEWQEQAGDLITNIRTGLGWRGLR